jgi:hypothetical protein
MKVLVTNNYFGSPLVWEYDQGSVERLDLVDFNTHTLLPDTTKLDGHLPYELAEPIICYLLNYRLATRNFREAFQLCTINRFFCKSIYKQIYGDSNITIYEMLRRIFKSFQFAETLYDDFLCEPNPGSEGFAAVSAYREGSLRSYPRFEPWDFRSDIDIQKLDVDLDDTFADLHTFPGQFHGDTVWIRGREDEGLYSVTSLHHPVIVLILCDYTYALIPTRKSINVNWYRFIAFLRRAFGARTGVCIMVKSQRDAGNPFIETTDMFLQI